MIFNLIVTQTFTGTPPVPKFKAAVTQTEIDGSQSQKIYSTDFCASARDAAQIALDRIRDAVNVLAAQVEQIKK